MPQLRFKLKNLVSTMQMLVAWENMLMRKTRIWNLGPKWKTVRKYFSNLAHCIVDKVGNDSSCGLFAIFDGHGGR